MADHPLRPARDRRLGAPLPHQLANPTWAYPDARGLAVPLFETNSEEPGYHAVLAIVSNGYPPHQGNFPGITHPSAARQQRSKLLSVTARLACVRPAASVQSEP